MTTKRRMKSIAGRVTALLAILTLAELGNAEPVTIAENIASSASELNYQIRLSGYWGDTPIDFAITGSGGKIHYAPARPSHFELTASARFLNASTGILTYELKSESQALLSGEVTLSSGTPVKIFEEGEENLTMLLLNQALPVLRKSTAEGSEVMLSAAISAAEKDVAEIRSQIDALKGLQGTRLIEKSIDLGVADSAISVLYPECEKLEDAVNDLRLNGAGAAHPDLADAAHKLENVRRILERASISVKSKLQTQLAIAEQSLADLKSH